MTKTILASLAILTLAASSASAMTHKTTNHRHAMKPAAAAPNSAGPVMGATPGFGPTAADREMYMKNERDAGLAGKR